MKINKRILFFENRKRKMYLHCVNKAGRDFHWRNYSPEELFKLVWKNEGKNAFWGCSKKGCYMCKARGKSLKHLTQLKNMDDDLNECGTY